MPWKVLRDYAHQVSVGIALILIFELGQVATYKFAMGRAFPENWGEYIWALVALAGVNVGGMGLLRATSPSLARERAAGKAAGSPSVNVEGDANVTTEQRIPQATAEHRVPRAEAKRGSAFGGASSDRA